MQKVTRNLRVLWRTQAMLSEHRLSAMARKSGMMAGAGLMALFGVAMLDVAAFFWLYDTMHPGLAALIVGLANFVLAGALVLIARSDRESREITTVRELQEKALEDLEFEASLVQAEYHAIRDDLRGIKGQIQNIVSNPSSLISPQLLAPILSAALKAFKK